MLQCLILTGVCRRRYVCASVCLFVCVLVCITHTQVMHKLLDWAVWRTISWVLEWFDSDVNQRSVYRTSETQTSIAVTFRTSLTTRWRGHVNDKQVNWWKQLRSSDSHSPQVINYKTNSIVTNTDESVFKQGVALTGCWGHNRTGLRCSVRRPTADAPGSWRADRPCVWPPGSRPVGPPATSIM